MYTSEELLGIFTKRVEENKPHRDYDHTVNEAKWCYQMMTGDDQKEILVTYKVRETEKQMQQRVRITNSRSQYVCNKVMKLYNEVHRCDEVGESITYNDDPGADKTLSLLIALSTFYEAKPLDNYLDTRFRDLIFYDPNAYVVEEFENNDPVNQKPTVYPFEVSAAEVYDHNYINGVLQFIIAQIGVSYPTKDRAKKETTGKKYTMYAIGYSFVLQHIPKDAVQPVTPDGYMEVYLNVRQDNGKVSKERFFFASYETKTTECPAKRAGYSDDPATKGRTKVSPLYPAKHILTDLIWNKSEYDLSKALHGFYQKFQYVSKCETCHGECEIDGRKCTKCKGTGKNSHTTVQDIVEILLPDSVDSANMPPLSNFVYYATIPEHLINKQKADYETDQKDVFNAIFGANVLDRTEMVETATAKHYDWRAVNNTLSEYADHRSETVKFFVRMTASHLAQADGLIVQHSYPSDFKLESVDDLLGQRSLAVTSGAPMAIITNIDLAILSKQHRDNPDFITAYKVKERFRPMRDKSRDEKAMLFGMLNSNDPERILYVYFEKIMDDVFEQYPLFAEMDYKKQKAIVYGKVAELMPNSPTLQTTILGDGQEEIQP